MKFHAKHVSTNICNEMVLACGHICEVHTASFFVILPSPSFVFLPLSYDTDDDAKKEEKVEIVVTQGRFIALCLFLYWF